LHKLRFWRFLLHWEACFKAKFWTSRGDSCRFDVIFPMEKESSKSEFMLQRYELDLR